MGMMLILQYYDTNNQLQKQSENINKQKLTRYKNDFPFVNLQNVSDLNIDCFCDALQWMIVKKERERDKTWKY